MAKSSRKSPRKSSRSAARPPKLTPAEAKKVAAKAASLEGKKTVARIRAQNSNGPTPVLCNASDLQYKAYATPYLGGNNGNVLTVLALGYYYPTPGLVKMFFESVYGEANQYKLMQTNSTDVFFLATYHTATWTSGAALVELGSSITVEDAFGTHTVAVEMWT
jgi:hypothetical protein